MNSRAFLVVAVVLLPVAAWSVSREMTGRAWLQQVPALPDNAQAAYGLWTTPDGSIGPGPAFRSVDDGMAAVMADQGRAVMASPQMQQQMAMAQQFQQQFGSTEGQAQLRSMTPAQLMAMAQQMQPAAVMSGPLSPQDQERMRRIGVYPDTSQLMADVQMIRNEAIALEGQWQSERQAIDRQESQARAALPVCHNEAGEPSEIAVRDVERQYGDARVQLATRYLGKFQALADQMKAAVLPGIDYGDAAMVAWSQIGNAAMKQQMATIARGAYNSALGDVGIYSAFIQDPVKQAAQAVADRKQVDVTYASAKGC